jgi:hypothetical protein
MKHHLIILYLRFSVANDSPSCQVWIIDALLLPSYAVEKVIGRCHLPTDALQISFHHEAFGNITTSSKNGVQALQPALRGVAFTYSISAYSA